MRAHVVSALLLAQPVLPAAYSQSVQPTATPSVSIAADGTVTVTRVVPIPKTISPEAREELRKARPNTESPCTPQQRQAAADKLQAEMGARSLKLYPAKTATETIAGVSVRIVTPMTIAPENSSKVLINLHGGGFRLDAGSLSETIPIASLTGVKVVAVLYRLLPENKFPAAVDDAVAVYQQLLNTYQPRNVGIYGTSAGGVLTAQVAVQLRKLKLPLPGALGIFAGGGDRSMAGDSEALFDLKGLSEPIDAAELNDLDTEYIGSTDPKDPVLSPLYSDLSGFPPTLFLTSTRDVVLSATSTLHRAFLRAGVDARLIVFEALPHAFWHNPDLPESKEANKFMAEFFERHLGK
ncbi:MAG: alpha/beta hydrolase fold domain-containing protein [Verrucomicrobia bacterium]|nr:alpha/beta hydrolase fold domain-containing protein [Verrucomicrobiota bacterium]